MAERTAAHDGATNDGSTDDGSARAHRAGAFDIRNFIGLLIGIYGLVLVIASFFDSGKELSKADGVRINLWAGLGMLVVAGAFVLWARLRPVVVPDDPDALKADEPDERPVH